MAGPTVDAGFAFQMAIDTLLHGENPALAHSFHRRYLAMASLTTDICCDMSFVTEKYEIWQIIYLNPFYRPTIFPGTNQLLDFWFVFANVFMAPHAKLHGGHARHDRTASINVAIGAVDFIVASVQLVAKLKRLHWRPIFGVEPQ